MSLFACLVFSQRVPDVSRYPLLLLAAPAFKRSDETAELAGPLEPHCGALLLQGKPAENMDDKAAVYPAATLQKILCFFACSTAFHTTHWMEYW